MSNCYCPGIDFPVQNGVGISTKLDLEYSQRHTSTAYSSSGQPAQLKSNEPTPNPKVENSGHVIGIRS